VGEVKPEVPCGYEEYQNYPTTLLRTRMTGDWESRREQANSGSCGNWPLIMHLYVKT